MHRLYVKEGKVLKSKGWVCPICKKTVIE